MKKELLILSGVALFGDAWKAKLAKELGIKNRQVVDNWVGKSERTPPDMHEELLAIMKVRQQKLSNAIKALEIDYTDTAKPVFIDYDKVYSVVSENGHLLHERFDNLEQAQEFVNSWDEDDQYLARIYQMTEAELLAMQVIENYADMFEREEILKLIQSENGNFNKSADEIYKELAVIVGGDYAHDYFDYYMKNELNFETDRLRKINAEYLRSIGGGLGTPPDEDEFIEPSPTISYKKFIMNKISEQINFVAEYL